MSNENKRSEDFALVLVGHGSLLPYGKDMLNAFCDVMKRREVFPKVEVAFLQKNEPSLEDVLRGLSINGVKKALVLPVFLANGVHTTKDIPSVIKKVTDETELRVLYAEPLGADERIVDILVDRANEALRDKDDL
ncbi:MAG: CbiX/SirB N-terminal domain-containing protein [Halobacteriota archaeon]|nr:CbiX/SirB N-terminal domain-containing protein [Halobacteriota archaeon]